MIFCKKTAIYSLVTLAVFAVVFISPNKTFATDYFTGGAITSTNLLPVSGTSMINSVSYTASSIPAGTSLKIEFSYDGNAWYSSAGVNGGWSTLSEGAHTIDLSGLGWKNSYFFYKLWFISDGTATPVFDDISLSFQSFDGTYYTNSSSGTLTTNDLLSTTTVAAINSFGYSISSLPPNTGITIQFSQDASTWYSATGASGGSNTLSAGTSTIDLAGLSWVGPHFYYQTTFTSSDGNNTPIIDYVGLNYTTTEPNAPTIGIATAGNAQVALTWTAPTFNGGSAITDYVIDYKATASSSWTTFADGVSTTTSTIVTGVGLVNGTSYDFRVSAVNSVGQGGASATVSATPSTLPDAPTSVVATSGNAQASVAFTAPANGGSSITGYTVTSNPGNFTAASSTSPIVVTGLTNGIAYTFVVTATNAVGTGAPSASTSPVTPATVPDAPTAVSTTGGNTQTSLTWAAPVWNGGANISDYVIDFKLNASSSWTTFADGTSIATSTIVTGLTNGSLYNFRISAVNSAGQGTTSATVNATPFTVPDAPTSVVATRGNTQSTVTFVAPANGGSVITGYTVSGGGADSNAGSTTLSHLITGLANGTPYTFTVTATNAAGTGPASSPSNSVTPATTPDAPTSPVATAGNAQASVAFVPPVGTGGSAITSYVVTSNPDSHIGTGSGSPIIVAGLANGTPYTFTVAAINDVGTGTPSVASVAVIPMTVPDAPTIGTTTAGNMQVSVEFTPPISVGGSTITSYKVISSPGNFTGTGGSSPIVVAGLTNGTPYTFTVTATNIVGTSSPSAPSSPATPVTTPDAPTGLTPTAGAGQVGLIWVAPVVTGGAVVTDYIIDYKFTASTSPADWHTFADGVSAGVTGTVTGLQNGASYDFRVSAYNIAGVGASSGIVSSMPITVPDAPTGVSAIAGNANATVSFAAPAFNGGSTITSYTITSTPGNISTTTTTTSGVVAGLTNGTPYTFVVTANNAVGVGAPSASSSPVTPVTVPGAPTTVSASEGNRKATVSFTAPDAGGTPILDYTITSSPENISTTTTSTTGVVTGLTNGVTYTFTVTARNAVGVGPVSASSNEVKLSTEPSAPTNLAAVVLGSSISLTWSAPANGGSAITDYIIEYQLTTGGTWTVFADATSISTTATVTGLSNRTSYDFRVSAVNIIGQSLPSNIVSATPGEPAQVIIQNFLDLTNPSIATAVRITNEGSTEYEYQYTWCVNSSANQDCGGDDIFSATAAKLIQSEENWDTTLNSVVPTPGNYYFHINVVYGSQSSSAYQSFTAVPTFPDAPTAVTATSSNAQATVSFNAPASNGGSVITGYTVTSGPGGLMGAGSTSPIVVTGLTNGTQYSFTVTATNGVGVGPASSPSNSVIPMTIPNAPTGLTATAGNTEVVLSWVAPLIDGGSAITDYVVEYKLSSEPTTWTVFADGVGAVTTATVTGLTNNLTYDFRVSAVNAVGQSAVNVSSASPASPAIPPSGGSGSHGGSRGGNYVPPTSTSTTPTVPINVPTPTVPAPTNPTTPASPTSPTTPTQPNQPSQPNEISATPVEHPVKIPTTPTAPISTTTGENGGLGYWWILIIASGVGALAFVGWLIFFIRRRLAEDANREVNNDVNNDVDM